MESEMEADVIDAQTKPAAPRTTRASNAEKIEDVPVNWARKAHTSDRIPIPSTSNLKLNDERTRVTLEDETSYAQNDCVFVAPRVEAPPKHRDDIDYAPPAAFRVARIMSFVGAEDRLEVRVNWFYRPADVAKRAANSRELFATFDTGVCKLTDFRGKCTVANKLELRNLGRYCDKPSQFWVSQLFDPVTRRVYDVLPVSSLKSLSPQTLDTLALSANSVVVPPEHTKKLCETQRKRKPAPAEQSTLEAEATPEKFALRSEWPFRYFDVATTTVSPKSGVPKVKPEGADGFLALDRHIDVPDWPGKPLVYYTMAAHNPASGESQKLRLLEAEDGQDLWNVDTSLPWVQQMPKGYISRGSDATATEMSLPLPGIADFVHACQSNYASKLDVEAHNLNFIDACCKVFTTNGGDENKALVEVSRATRRSIGEPELSAAEKDAFEAAMNPFHKLSWHDVFRAVKTKPIADLSQYFWSQRPDSAVTSADNQFWETDPPPEAAGVQCAVCLAEDAGEWKHLPGYVPVPAIEPDTKKALCARCARLWLRYQISWQPAPRVDELQDEGQDVESELVEDAKAVKAEEERRKKRRVAAQEKQEALARKREEAKQAKAEAKAAGKPVKAPARKKAKREVSEPAPSTPRDDPSAEEPAASPSEPREQTPVETKNELAEEPQDDSEAESGTQTPRRRPVTTSQLTLASIDDDFLNSITDDTPPDPAPQNCVVCGQLDVSMDQQTCASCGLNVHTLCYGPGRHDGSGPWICDCCINSRSGLGMDTFYVCSVCPPKQPVYVRWLSGEEVGASDVLKGTVDRSWCHLRCAVWIEQITFLNPAALDGVDLGNSTREVNQEPCAICMSAVDPQSEPQPDATNTTSKNNATTWARSGVRVHCDMCDESFHVSCAAEQSYAFGFLKSATPPRPVIRCSRHGSSHADLKPMSYVNAPTDLTVLQEYVRAYKQSKRTGMITAAERAQRIADNESSRVARGIAPDTSLIVFSTGLLVSRRKLRCAQCGSRTAPYWLATLRGHACPLCFRGLHWPAKRLPDTSASAVREGLLNVVNTVFRSSGPRQG